MTALMHTNTESPFADAAWPRRTAELMREFGYASLTLADKPLIERYFGLEDCGFADYSFSMAYLWSAAGTIFWKESEGTLFICRILRKKADLLYPPLGTGGGPAFTDAMKRAAEELPAIDRRAGGPKRRKPRIFGLTPERAAEAARIPGLTIEEDLPDYIYDRARLSEMAGPRYKTRRENINKFLRTYKNFAIEELSAANAPEALKYLKRWYAENRPDAKLPLSLLFDADIVTPEKNFVWESYHTRNYLRNYRSFPAEGMLFKLYGAVAGFIIGERIGGDTFAVLIEKVDNNLFGLSQFLFREFVRERTGGARYINTADDSGMEGLRILKGSYNPEFLMKRYYAGITGTV